MRFNTHNTTTFNVVDMIRITTQEYINPNCEEIADTYSSFDVDGNGEIDIDEFIAMIEILKQKQSKLKDDVVSQLNPLVRKS